MQFFVAKVTWYDPANHQGPATDNIAIAAESHSSVAAQIETYFGEGIETVEITLLNPDRPLVLIDDKTYEGLIRSEC